MSLTNPTLNFVRYPNDYDDPRPTVDNLGLPTIVDLQTPVKAESVNRVEQTSLALEFTLGILPQGTYTTVRQRLDSIEVALSVITGTVGQLANPISAYYNSTLIQTNIDSITFSGNVSVTQNGKGINVALENGIDGYLPVKDTFTPTNSQITFTLSQVPYPTSLLMFINGIKVDYANYTISSGNVVNYNNFVPLLSTDSVDFIYYVVMAGGSYIPTKESISLSNGQTSIPLSFVPWNGLVFVFLNGLEEPASSYSVSSNIITWLGATLSASYTFEVFYFQYFTGLPQGGGSGSITVQQNGSTVVMNTTTLNFLGADVLVTGSNGIANISIPPPVFLSHWNTGDGTNGNQFVTESFTRVTAHISHPYGGEGTPFAVNGWDGYNEPATNSSSVFFTTPSNTTGFGGNSTISAVMYSANGSTILDQVTTTAITSNATFTSVSGNISVVITNFSADSTRYKANASITFGIKNIFTAHSLDGGRFHVKITHTTDSTTDTGAQYIFTESDVFYDTNNNAPAIDGYVSIAETPGSIITKYISGIQYYTTTAAFTVAVTTIDYLNQNTQKISANLHLDAPNYGIASIDQSPFGSGSGYFSNYTNNNNQMNIGYSNNVFTITATNFRYFGTGAVVTGYVADPWETSVVVSSSSNSILVDTFGQTSSALYEDFDDEVYRMNSTFTSSWSGTSLLGVGDALCFDSYLMVPNQSRLSNATLNSNWSTYKPNLSRSNPNYSALTTPVYYYRNFANGTSTINNFSMVFTGNFAGGSALADLLSSALQIFVYKIAGAGHTGAPPGNTTPLYLHGSNYYNFATFDDGTTDGQIKLNSSSGNYIACTLGSYYASNGFYFKIVITNPSIQINSISMTFNG